MEPPKLAIGSHLRYADVDGRIVFLDLVSETYHVLDPVASAIWRLVVLECTRQEIVLAMQQQFAVDQGRLDRDVAHFVRNCIAAGYLVELTEQSAPSTASQHATAAPRASLLLPPRAWWSLIRASRSLKRQGFFKTYQWFASLPRLEFEAQQSPRLLARAVGSFAWAENFCYLKGAPRDCLPRSLALFGFLRSLGLAVEHVIGVQMFPFAAHAWVELQGQVLHDNPANSRQFTAIARLPA